MVLAAFVLKTDGLTVEEATCNHSDNYWYTLQVRAYCPYAHSYSFIPRSWGYRGQVDTVAALLLGGGETTRQYFTVRPWFDTRPCQCVKICFDSLRVVAVAVFKSQGKT